MSEPKITLEEAIRNHIDFDHLIFDPLMQYALDDLATDPNATTKLSNNTGAQIMRIFDFFDGTHIICSLTCCGNGRWRELIGLPEDGDFEWLGKEYDINKNCFLEIIEGFNTACHIADDANKVATMAKETVDKYR